MEKRKITVVSDKKTSPVTFESEATTLGELKADLNRLNIDYSNAEFTEGNSALRLINDNSELPKQVKRRLTGQMTDHLVISIKTINKRLNQGSYKPTGLFHRTVANAIVKYNPELKDMIVNKFGRNYTQLESSLLCEYLRTEGYFREGMPIDKIDANEYVKKDPNFFKKSASTGNVVIGKPGLTEHLKKEDKVDNKANEVSNRCDKKPEQPKCDNEPMSVKSIIDYLKTLGEKDRDAALAEINRAFADESYSPDEIRNILNSLD